MGEFHRDHYQSVECGLVRVYVTYFECVYVEDGFTPFDSRYTIWLFNIAIENGPFIDDVPIKTSIYWGFSMAMLVITTG